jgi:HEAT repeat protein
VLLLWAIAGIGLLLLQEDTPAPGPKSEADPRDPELHTRGRVAPPPVPVKAEPPTEVDIQAAAEALLGKEGHPRAFDPPHARAEIERILRLAKPYDAYLVRRLLRRLRDWGPRSTAVLDLLLADYARTQDLDWRKNDLLRTLLAIAPDDPRLRPVLLAAMGSFNAGVRTLARHTLLQGPTEDVLALLADAPAGARIEGARVLLGRGVAKERLVEHVLVALQRGGAGTRTRAIKLLGKMGGDVRDVLPIIEEHLASEDKGRWLSAVEALGALATVPGEKAPVIRRLLEVGRRPDVRVRRAGVQAILMHDAQPAPVIELLTYLLDDADAGVRAEAVDALGELCAHHKTSKRALERARTDPSPQVRELVVYWLDPDEDD